MTHPAVLLAWNTAALLGEGPTWVAQDNALWFVDIKRGRLHRHCPATDENRTLRVGGRPSFVLPTDDGALLIGNGAALQRLDPEGRTLTIATIAMPAHNRTNDATVAPDGRLWFGTMDDEGKRPSGAIYLFDGSAIQAMGGECVITNGPAVSADGCWLYHVDTIERTIWRSAIDGDRLGKSHVFARIEPADGHPDGVTLDAEGCLWVALWGGWRVRRYRPDGVPIDEVELPCANVTKLAFGGADLATAFVTTAAIGLSSEARPNQPLAGGLFSFGAPAAGLPSTSVRLAR